LGTQLALPNPRLLSCLPPEASPAWLFPSQVEHAIVWGSASRGIPGCSGAMRLRGGASTFGPDVPAPGLRQVWNTLLPLVSSALESTETELEVRFGQHPPGIGPEAGFPTGVSPKAFDRVLKALQGSAISNELAVEGEGWQVSRDWFYANRMRVTETKGPKGSEKVLVNKRLLQRIDLQGSPGEGYAKGGLLPDPTLGNTMLRFSWKTEEQLE